MALTIFRVSDNLLTVSGLHNQASGAYLNTAIVTVTVVDDAGDEVSGQSWPTTLTYVTGTNGNYRGTLSDSLVLTAHTTYIAQISANAGAGLARYWEVPLYCKVASE